MIEGWVLCEELADGPDHIIPGHDPEVLRRFPKVPGDPESALLHLAAACLKRKARRGTAGQFRGQSGGGRNREDQ